MRRVSAVEGLKLCDCYDYQSCETADWETTEAHAIVDSLRGRLIGCLPGYDKADWEFRG